MLTPSNTFAFSLARDSNLHLGTCHLSSLLNSTDGALDEGAADDGAWVHAAGGVGRHEPLADDAYDNNVKTKSLVHPHKVSYKKSRSTPYTVVYGVDMWEGGLLLREQPPSLMLLTQRQLKISSFFPFF
jgi:hypothetical protein